MDDIDFTLIFYIISIGSIPSILNYYDKQFYGSTLIPTLCGTTSNEAIKLASLSRFLKHCSGFNGNEPFGMTFINVNGRNDRLKNKKSWKNEEEAALVWVTRFPLYSMPLFWQ